MLVHIWIYWYLWLWNVVLIPGTLSLWLVSCELLKNENSPLTCKVSEGRYIIFLLFNMSYLINWLIDVCWFVITIQILHSKLGRNSDAGEPSLGIKSAILYEGSITYFDPRLYGCDIGTCLEVLLSFTALRFHSLANWFLKLHWWFLICFLNCYCYGM